MQKSDLQKSYDDLDKCLNRYKEDLNILWEGYREDIVNRYHLPDPENLHVDMATTDNTDNANTTDNTEKSNQDQAQPFIQLQSPPQNTQPINNHKNLREEFGLNALPHFEDKDNEFFKEIDKQLNCLDIKDETAKLLNYLADNLKWAQKKKSFGYLIERKVMCDDANNILKDVMSLKNADLKEADTFLDKVNTLEIKMKHYQSQTRKLWSLNSLNPFGHADVRKVFDQGLLLINDIKKHTHEENEHLVVDPHQQLQDSLESNLTALFSRDHSLSSDSQSFKFDKSLCHTKLKEATNGGKTYYEITVEVAKKNVRSAVLEEMGFSKVMPNIKRRQMNEAKLQVTRNKLVAITEKLREKEEKKVELTTLRNAKCEYDDLVKAIKAKNTQLAVVAKEREVLSNEITEINSKLEQPKSDAANKPTEKSGTVDGGGILARMKRMAGAAGSYALSKAKSYYNGGSSGKENEEEQLNKKIAVEKRVAERDEKLKDEARKDEELSILNAELANLKKKIATINSNDTKDPSGVGNFDVNDVNDINNGNKEIEALEVQIDELTLAKTELMNSEKSLKEKIRDNDSQWNKMTIFKRQFSSLEKLQDFEKELCSKQPNRPQPIDKDAHPLVKTEQEKVAHPDKFNHALNQFRLFCNHAWHDTSNKLSTKFKETKEHVNDLIHKDAAKMNQFSIFCHDAAKKCHDAFKKFEHNIEHTWDVIRKHK